MSVPEFLTIAGVFGRDEFAVGCGWDPVADRARVDKRLAHLHKQGHVERIRRGLYLSRVGHARADPFVVATNAAPDAVVACHSALQFHGRAHSASARFTFFTSHAVRPFAFDGTQYLPIDFPCALDTEKKQWFGVVITVREARSVRVTNPERTVVDVLDRPDMCGGWEEVLRSIESIEYLDIAKMLEYVELLGNGTLAAKVGWFLEDGLEDLGLNDRDLRAFEKMVPRSPHYLERSAPRGDSVLRKRWNLIVPEWVEYRHWMKNLAAQ